MVRIITIVFLLACTPASALESVEFQLYGVNSKGQTFDIHPYGKGTSAEGDADEPGGIHGEFHMWVGTDRKGSFKPVGSCRLSNLDTYTFSCDKGDRLFSGVIYKGQKLTESQLDSHPQGKKLYRAFIKRFEYGDIAAVYQCKSGCSPLLPPYLIFVWRGD